jgi:hypothetical protein
VCSRSGGAASGHVDDDPFGAGADHDHLGTTNDDRSGLEYDHGVHHEHGTTDNNHDVVASHDNHGTIHHYLHHGADEHHDLDDVDLYDDRVDHNGGTDDDHVRRSQVLAADIGGPQNRG